MRWGSLLLLLSVLPLPLGLLRGPALGGKRGRFPHGGRVGSSEAEAHRNQ